MMRNPFRWRWLFILPLLPLLGVPLIAQESDAPAADEPAPAQPAPVRPEAPAPAADEEEEEFVPDPRRGPEERVSADNNLSFPVDI